MANITRFAIQGVYAAFRRADVYCISTRAIFINPQLCKRRKTTEERKAPRIIEYSPKSKFKKDAITVDIWRNMTVQQLAQSMGKDLEDIQEISLYVDNISDIEPHHRLEDPQIIKDIVKKAGFKSRIVPAPQTNEVQHEKEQDVFPRPPASDDICQFRPPVVTVMGHVDHGKTSLLDALRGASVAQGEAGGITQHIGAFTVQLKEDSDECVTFLDTPGHAAFSAMRARGAHVTDIIVLVVAADDGVMAQTREVIKLAQDCNVPIIVAINKIDKPDADIERTKRDLAKHGVNLEDMGGDVQAVPVSATTAQNLDLLTEALMVQAQVIGLRGDPTGLVEGTVIESRTDAHRGKLSTALISRGTLRKGCVLVAGLAGARVRAMFDHNGYPVSSAGPGTPVEVLGWRDLPNAGDLILEVESDKKASSVLRFRHNQMQQHLIQESEAVILAKAKAHNEEYIAERDARRKQGFFRKRRTGPRPKEYTETNTTPTVHVIVKGDVHGSVEAILDVLETYNSDDQCKLDVVHYGVGDVTENDIVLAESFSAIVYAFNVNMLNKPPPNIKVKYFDIIYRLVDDLKVEISKQLPLKPIEEILGEANVLQIFHINEGKSKQTVLGCRCVKGLLKKNCIFRLIRDNNLIHEGSLISMRHLKNEVDSIKKDVECGLRFEDQTVEVMPGDKVVCFRINQEEQTTDWDPGF